MPSATPRAQSTDCVITVGSTGAGKSTIISILTGRAVVANSGHQSVTQGCDVFYDIHNIDPKAYVDTKGLEDSGLESDERVFIHKLRYLSDHGLTKVKGLVWCINPTERMTSTLQKQANFISQFGVNIWKNVIIQVKKPSLGISAEHEAQGALAAAVAEGANRNELLNNTMAFTLLESLPESVTRGMTTELCQMYNYLTKQEVQEKYKEILSRLGPSIQVVFNNKRCRDCGIVGDERLLYKICHMVPVKVHGVKLSPDAQEYAEDLEDYHEEHAPTKYHPQALGSYHPGQYNVTETIVQASSGGLVGTVLGAAAPVLSVYNPVAGAAATAGSQIANEIEGHKGDTNRSAYYTCCGAEDTGAPGCKEIFKCCDGLPGSEGCLEKFVCCGSAAGSRGCKERHLCCGRDRESEGCRSICIKCRKDWGSPTNDCFEKNHTLEEFNNA